MLSGDGEEDPFPIGEVEDVKEDSPSSVNTSDRTSSDEDDKAQKGYFKRTKHFYSLPPNVRNAIELSKEKSKHSEFYYKLKGLNDKISTYK